jgi:hypothetical protein
MAYTTIDKPTDYFEALLYTGDGSGNRDISGLDFQPDWVWIKDRANPGTTWHHVFDSSRGANNPLNTNVDNAQGSVTTFPAFNSDGFRVNAGNLNTDTQTNVAWCWKANGGTTTSGAGNDTIATSTHQASTTSGFSIVTYTGEEANKTVKHGLSTALDMLIVKNLSTAKDYRVWFKGFSGTERLELNNTEAKATTSTSWNGTVPGSSVFSLGDDTNTNTDGDNFIAYCFHSVKGFSSFGKYIGNGNNNGPFLYTGFKPALFFRKRTDGANNWNIWDNKRTPFNEMHASSAINTADAEDANTDYNDIDFLSNGIKIHDTGDSHNGSDMNYVYGAFAEHPFVSSEGIPCTAR